jgi:hypothetical protein
MLLTGRLRARPFAEQHSVANLDVDRNELAILVAPTRSDSHDPALLRLFLGRVWDKDAAGGFLVGIDTGEHHAIVKWTELHGTFSYLVRGKDCPKALQASRSTCV